MNAARRIAWFTMLIILSQLVIACGGDDSLPLNPGQEPQAQVGIVSAAPQERTYPVDPVFLDFYNFLGGEERLGPAISTVLGSGVQKQQYVQAALLLYDGQAPESERFSLAPLGNGFTTAGSVQEQITPGILQAASQSPIHPEFLEMYETLGGARFVGQALVEARYNPEKARWEQYFENLGFYRLDQDKQVRLMAYGASACDFRCRFRPVTDSIPSRWGVLPEPFSGRAAALGEDFTGGLLSGPRIAPDGRQEVVFENLVLVVDRANPSGVTARPLPEAAGLPPQPPVARLADPLLVFYPLRGELGHNVPEYFDIFLAQHGGLEVSGLPISEVTLIEPGYYRQCFTNLCLDFNLNNPVGKQLGLASLGNRYLESSAQEEIGFVQSQSLEGVALQLWEGKTFVSSQEAQEVHAGVFAGGQPLKNREPVLSLTLPDGSQLLYHFPPTGEDGLTSLNLPEIQASSGTLIAYQVCLHGLAGDQTCMGDNFLIWNHP